MIHTARITAQIYRDKYDYLISHLPALETVNEYLNRTNYYSRKGIMQVELVRHTYRWKGIDYEQFYIAMRINLSVIMGENKVFLLDGEKYTAEDIIEGLCKRLTEIPQFADIKLHEETFNVSRADFAVDITFPNPELLALLCSLSFPYKRGRLENVTISGKSIKEQQLEGCYFRNKSRTINYYVKGAELVNNSRPVTDEELSRALNTFRIEIQHKDKSVRRLMKKYNISRELLPFLDEDFTLNYLYEQTKNLFGTEPYVSESRAREIIDNSKYSGYDKEVLKSIINAVHIYNGLYFLNKAIEEKDKAVPKQYGNRCKFNKYIKKIRRLGIQPATIPDSYGIDEIPSIANLLKGEQEMI